MSLRHLATAMLVGTMTLLVACGIHEPSQEDLLVGTWVQEMPQTEWGPMTMELTLERGGQTRRDHQCQRFA
ncbi:hypothetical protein ACERK3_13660 [Phycisphaerales bacterium AB-hyl4]|uniref:Uncharacterized protein n=1 Tax=Natronomicrosphaera hydrolytica TaxID=3242702 RepID=A0ABV4U743_9BACT